MATFRSSIACGTPREPRRGPAGPGGSWGRLFGAAVLVLASGPALAQTPGGPLTVSPGAVERFATASQPCPTFSWTAVEGALAYEVALYRVDAEGALAGPLFERTVPAGATSWTPSADGCPEPGGRYAWVVRTAEGRTSGPWSEPALFVIPRAADPMGLAEAVETVRRYLADARDARTAPAASNGEEVAGRIAGRLPERDEPKRAALGKGLSSSAAAIRGELDLSSGTVYGVVGVSNSPDGAGLGAENSTGGPDLILGGAPSALLTEAGITRDSPGAVTFDVSNPSGPMILSVDGAGVFTTANDGPGSGLDADTLDGVGSAGFAPAVHPHDDRYFTENELATSGGGSQVHWGNLISVPPGLGDGDDDTTYGAGAGIVLSGNTLSLSAASALTPADNRVTSHGISDSVGGNGSITIGADGLALISYRDYVTQELKVAHCNTPSCTSATTLTLDDSGSVGAACAVTVGTDGVPLIEYYDTGADNLKVLHCANTFCVPYFRRR